MLDFNMAIIIYCHQVEILLETMPIFLLFFYPITKGVGRAEVGCVYKIHGSSFDQQLLRLMKNAFVSPAYN
jgi:hypothetical protein